MSERPFLRFSAGQMLLMMPIAFFCAPAGMIRRMATFFDEWCKEMELRSAEGNK